MTAPAPAPTANPTAVHYDIVKNAVPTWLLHAGSDTHARMRTAGASSPAWYVKGRKDMPEVVEQLAVSYTDYRISLREVNEIFDLLPSPEAFARPRLEAELEKRFGLKLDTTGTYLFHARHAVVDNSFAGASKDPMVQLQNARKAAISTLLQAAMQNFEAVDAAAGGMDDDAIRAGLYEDYPLEVLAIRGKRLSIEPHEFASLCREMDLGRQYQDHIELLLQWLQRPGDAAGTGRAEVAARVKLLERATLHVHAHVALLKGDIDADMHRQLTRLTASSPYTAFSHLSVFDTPLTGVTLIHDTRRYSDGLERIIAYIPDDPVAPLKCYPSRLAFMQALRDRLIEPAYQRFFATLVPARERNRLFTRLRQTLYPKVWNSTRGWYEVKLNKDAAIHLSTTPFDTYWLEALHDRKVATLKDDARFHLVPTADEDQKTRDARLQYFEDKFFDALNVAAFVVPGVGEIMLAVTAAQLCYSTYEGFDALVKGDQDSAFGYLMGVVDNLAMIALMAAGGAGLAADVPGVSVPEPVKAMRPVTLPDGTRRLWKPDLAPFHHDVVLPAALKPNELGLYEYAGKLWLPKDGRTYSVRQGPYRLAHPDRPGAYEPLLRHNGKGAWLHELDRPQDWEGHELFRRLGPMTDGISDEAGSRILRASDTHEAVLRRSLAEGERPPPLFDDTLQRFRLDQQLDTFIHQLESGFTVTDDALQLQLLSEAPGWPDGRLLEWVDTQGTPLRTFGTPPGSRPPVRVVEGTIALDVVLEQLDEAEVKALLQENVSAGQLSTTARTRELRQRLAEQARRHRTRLFEQRYQALQTSDDAVAARLQQQFEGLPRAVADELAAQVTPRERTRLLADGTPPERVSGEARFFLETLRLNRAYEGLYLETGPNPDTEVVKLHSIEALPGWSKEVRIRVRDGAFHGPLLDQVGTDQARVDKVLIKDTDRYETRDSDNRHLHGRDDIYGAVLHALPDAQRAELGFPGVNQQQALQQTVRDAPLLPRYKVRELLNMAADKPGAKSPMALAEGRPGMALRGPARPGRIITEDSLLDKIRILELESPLDAHARTLLEELYAAGLNREAIDARLNRLLDEQQHLRAALDEWVMESAAIPSMDPARAGSRQRIGDALWHCWRHGALPETGRGSHELRLDAVYLADFPPRLPSFLLERVERLSVRDLRLNTLASPWISDLFIPNQLDLAIQAERTAAQGLLQRFPAVTALSIEGAASPAFAWFRDWPGLIAEQYPELTELSLRNLRIAMQESTLATIRRLPRLRRLDLSGNPFYAPLDISGLELEYLGMDHTADQWSVFRPDWFNTEVLEHTTQLSVRGNHLSELPAHILANPAGSPRQTRLIVRDNPLPRETMITLRMSERSDSRFIFDADLPEDELQGLVRESRALRQAVDDWLATSSSSSTVDAPRRALRQRTAEAINEYWQTYSVEGARPFLALEGGALADFPGTLPDRFYENIHHLTVTRTDATAAQINSLLQRFPRLRNLIFTDHISAMTELPTALQNMTDLRAVSLVNQGLTIDQAALDFFAGLPSLESLVLNGNTLGTITHARGLAARNMAWLSLDNTGLRQWPEWLGDLIPDHLERLGLENNGLTELPEHILANHRRDTGHTVIELRNNPLTHETMRRAHISESYYRPYGFDMDLPEDILELSQSDAHSSDSEGSAHTPHSPGLDVEASAQVATVEPWLAGDVEAEAGRRQTWEQIATGADAGHLLNMIDRLRQTADFRRLATRAELNQRVWTVLQAAAADTELRLLLNGMAEEPLQLLLDHSTCPDGIRLAFNQMEIQVFTRQSLAGIEADQRGQVLDRLVRQLYRSQELDRFAVEQAGARDQAEVRLAYRLRLARELNLPLPPGRMLYEGTADLRPGELDDARRHVQRGEQGDAFLQYAADRDFWQAYLRDTYPERFAALKVEYEARVLKLTEDSPGESIEQLGDQFKQLETQWHSSERQLLMELTALEGRHYA
ncbi:NEL-type E3 ubiquitin ligase domain-containing protein [Pseudomonas sp. RIT-To-2]|uniref:NEL-type E3 ubiquitin ligase domain-containing protein n=1 Tax=Pseudomonas sp. RIT-To-2 TaxID=3462541 RepID=UPI002413918F